MKDRGAEMNQIEEMALKVLHNMNRVLTDENERGPEVEKIEIGKNGDDFSPLLTAELLALAAQFTKFTNREEIDLIDFIGILNRIAVEYLLNCKEKPEGNTP